MIALRAIFFLGFCAFFLNFPSSFRRWTHPFCPQRLAVEYPARVEWETSPTLEQKEELERILSQPFAYLGKGLQTFAFGSRDGEYVLKLFRFDSCKVPLGQRGLKWMKDRLGIASRDLVPLNQRLEKTMHSCWLSYQKLQDETGVVWVQLNPKKEMWPSLQVQDRMGRWHTIDPGRYRFMLQKKATLLRPTLEAAKNDPEKLQRLIASFANLLYSLEEKGAYNIDPKMASNFGFIGEKAIQIDFGNFVDRPELALYGPDHYAARLRGHLVKYFPGAVAALDEEMRR